MSLAYSLCRDPGTLVRRNKNQLCDYMITEPPQLAGIPGGNFPSSHACRAARRMNQARNRTAGNGLFMRIASPAHVIRPLLGVVLSRSLHVKALEFTSFMIRVWENTTKGFKNRTRFAREDVGLCRFYSSTVKECNLFMRSFCSVRF